MIVLWLKKSQWSWLTITITTIIITTTTTIITIIIIITTIIIITITSEMLDEAVLDLNRGGLLPSRQRIRYSNLDCLGAASFRCEIPVFWLLEKFGFPWILSSES
jgi:hypothetical protein